MANNDIDVRIKAILDTALAVENAEDAGAKIEKALSVQTDDATIKAYQESLKKSSEYTKFIRDYLKENAISTEQIKLAEADITKQKELQAKQTELIAKQTLDTETNLPRAQKRYSYFEANKTTNTKTGQTAATALRNVQDTIDATNKALADTNAQLAEIESRGTAIVFNSEKVKDEVTEYKAEMLKGLNLADQIIERQETLANSTEQTAATQASSMDEVARAMEQVQSATDAYKTSVEEAGNVEVNINGFTEQTAASAESATENMEEVAQAVQQVGQSSTEAENDVSQLLHRIAELKENIAKIESGQPIGADNHKATIEEYQRMNVELRESQKLLKIYRGQMEAVSNSTGKGGRDTRSITMAMRDLKSVANGVVKTFKQFNVLGKIVDRLKSSVNSIKKNLDSTMKSLRSSLKHGFTRFTKYILGFKSLYFLVRRLRKFVVEGIENLVQYNDKLSKGVKSHNLMNDAMNDLQTSLLYLKNAWAAAFAPIVIKVMPILTGLIDYLAVAGNAIAKFVAELTGQATAYNALKVQAQDYADSLDDAGKSAKKNAKDQDKLNQSLADYDKLLVIKSKNDDDANGTPSGGSGASAYSPKVQDMFTTILADENSFASALGDALKKANLEQAGEMIGQAIKDGLDNIKWDEIQKKVGEVTTRVGTFLKGIFNTEGLMSTVGKSAGEVVNTISIFVTNILNQTKDIDFGGGLATAINAFVDATNWDLIKFNIKSAITQFKKNVKSLIDGLNWTDIQFEIHGLAEALSSSIASTLADKDFMTSLGKGFAGIINTISSVIKGLLDGTKGKDIGGGVASALNAVFEETDFEQIGKNISDAFVFIFSNAASFLDQVNWEELGKAVEKFLLGIDWEQVMINVVKFIVSSNNALTRIFATIGNAVSETLMKMDPDDVSKMITSFIESIDFGSIADVTGKLVEAIIKSTMATGKVIFSVIAGLFGGLQDMATEGLTGLTIEIKKKLDAEGKEYTTWNVFLEIGKMLIEGFLQGVVDAVKGIGEWLATYVIAPIVDAFTGKDGFDIHSPSKRAEAWGKAIIDGLKNGLLGMWDAIKNFFLPSSPDSIFAKIKGVFSSTNFETIKTALSTAWSTVTGVFTSTWSKIGGHFAASNPDSIWAKLKGKFSKEYITSNIANGLSSAWTAVTNVFSGTWGKIKQYFEQSNSASIWAKLREKFSADYIKKHLADGLTKAWGSVTNVFKNTWDNIKKYFDPTNKDSFIRKAKDAFLGTWAKINDENTYTGGFVGGILDAVRSLKANLKRPINAVIDMVQNFINYCIKGINDLTKTLNNIKITIGTTTYGFNFPKINDIKLPHLAQGAIIPPNKEFLAVLGDQKQGTNIETPLNTMIDAFKIALAENGGNTNHDPIVLQLNSRVVAQAVWDEEAKKYKQTGFGLAY